MSTYLAIKVPIFNETKWYNDLTHELNGVGVRWQNGHYHITLAYLDEVPKDVDLGSIIGRKVVGKAAPNLTFDKLDAFTGGSGKEHIVYLTVSNIPESFSSWVDEIRRDIISAGGVIKTGFKLHVTLGRVDAGKIGLEELQARINKVCVPGNLLRLNELEYLMHNKEHTLLRGWRLYNFMPFNSYMNLNYEVMKDTVCQYETIPELQGAVHCSIERQYIVAHEDAIDIPAAEKCDTRVVVSGKRSFEAAKGYPGKKVAVLNFANNHSVGGSPFRSGAQEESLCRCSTLYPCLEALNREFYLKHTYQFTSHKINYMGNDDLIYTPGVVVFKTDERTDPVFPKMMERQEWYMVDVITCAAPQMQGQRAFPSDYEAKIASRIKKIYDVATKEHVDVLILGAWGCGAFANSVDVVARQFMTQMRNYDFEVIEFALDSRGDLSDNRFAQAVRGV